MIRIITDSSSDLDLEQAAQLNVDVIPIHIRFGETEYQDRQNLSVTDFYNKLKTVTELPTTSQINPFQFCKVFQPYVEAGDEIVGIFLSSELSGTFQSAQTAKQMLNADNIYLVDSLNAALGHHLLVQIAVQLRDQGASAQQIAAQITALSKKVRLIACVKTMKYLAMGGRIPAAAAKIGDVLGITPIVTVVDGKVKAPVVSRKRSVYSIFIFQYKRRRWRRDRYACPLCCPNRSRDSLGWAGVRPVPALIHRVLWYCRSGKTRQDIVGLPVPAPIFVVSSGLLLCDRALSLRL